MHAAAVAILPPLVAGIILTGVLAFLTGGLHLDGLADTADAFFSGGSVQKKLRIMKDSRIGAMGAIAVSLCLFMKAALIGSLDGSIAFGALLLMPAASRCCLLLPAFAFRYGRDTGTGRPFITALSLRTVVVASGATPIVTGGVLGLHGLASLTLTAVTALGVGRILSRNLGGMTGDTLGAVNELGEIVFLTALLILR